MLTLNPLKNKKLNKFYLLFLVLALFNYILFLVLFGAFDLNYKLSGFLSLLLGIGLVLFLIKNKIMKSSLSTKLFVFILSVLFLLLGTSLLNLFSIFGLNLLLFNFVTSFILSFIFLIILFLILKYKLVFSSLFYSKFFLIFLGIKVIASFLFASDSFLVINDFVDYFLSSGFINPYSHFLDINSLAFPYAAGALYLLSIFKILFSVFNFINFDLFSLRIPVLLADILIYYYLCKLLKDNIREVQVFYWASPIVFYINYFIGGLDVIPIALLVAVVYYLINNNYFVSSLFLGFSISTKTGIIVILPVFFVYLLKQKIKLYDIMKYLLFSIILYFVFALPFLFTKGYYKLALGVAQDYNIFNLSLPISSGFQFLFLPAVYVVLVLYLFSFKRMNKEMLLMLITLIFIALVVLVPPLPNWYYWLLPFLVYFFVKEGRNYYVNFWAFNIFYFAYFILVTDSFIFNSFQFINEGIADLPAPYFLIKNLGLNMDLIVNISYTLLIATLLLSAYWVYKYGIRNNTYYKDRDKPALIGIAGDSGVGKTTLSNILLDLFGAGFCTVISGDDAHKWERGDKNWENITQLDPRANKLHMNISHLSKLKSEKPIGRRFYNHDTGRFTSLVQVNPNKFLIFEGLHSFYIGAVRNMCDIKIFVDTDEDLRTHWKVLRDTKERGYSREKVLSLIDKRKPDSDKHILPQRKFSDIVVSLYLVNKIRDFGLDKNVKIALKLVVDNNFDVDALADCLPSIKIEVVPGDDLKTQILNLYGNVSSYGIASCAAKIVPNYEDIILNKNIKWSGGYYGIIQIVVLYYLDILLREKKNG